MAQCLSVFQHAVKSSIKFNSIGVNHVIITNFLKTLLPIMFVYFSIANVSIDRLYDFTTNILHVSTSKKAIGQTFIQAAGQANKKLERWDKMVGEEAQILLLDATWKGKRAKFFNVMDQKSRYLLISEPIKQESASYLNPFLHKLAELCHNVRILITDMAKGYLTTLPRAFWGTIIIFCHSHLKRAIFRKVFKSTRKF